MTGMCILRQFGLEAVGRLSVRPPAAPPVSYLADLISFG